MWLWWQRHWVESLLCIRPHEMRHSWWFSQSDTHKRTDVRWDALLCTQRFNDTRFTSHFNIYLVLLTHTHPNKSRTHSLTSASLPRGRGENEMRASLSFMCDVRASLPASSLGGWYVSVTQEMAVAPARPSYSFHPQILADIYCCPPHAAGAWALRPRLCLFLAWQGKSPVWLMAHREPSQHTDWQQPPYPIAPCAHIAMSFFIRSFPIAIKQCQISIPKYPLPESHWITDITHDSQ